MYIVKEKKIYHQRKENILIQYQVYIFKQYYLLFFIIQHLHSIE